MGNPVTVTVPVMVTVIVTWWTDSGTRLKKSQKASGFLRWVWGSRFWGSREREGSEVVPDSVSDLVSEGWILSWMHRNLPLADSQNLLCTDLKLLPTG